MLCIITCLSYAFSKLMFFLFFIGNFDIFYCSNYFLSFYYCRFYLFCITISSKLHQPHLVSSQFITCLRRIYLPFHNGVYLAIYTCLFRWCYGHFYNRLTQFIVYCSYVVCTILLRRPVDLSTHWTVTAISLHVTTFVGVCHE